jgi:hypothetical protein
MQLLERAKVACQGRLPIEIPDVDDSEDDSHNNQSKHFSPELVRSQPQFGFGDHSEEKGRPRGGQESEEHETPEVEPQSWDDLARELRDANDLADGLLVGTPTSSLKRHRSYVPLSGVEIPTIDEDAAAAVAAAGEQLAETGASRNTLRVDILSCSGLRNADGIGNKSDPYVVVKIGKKRGRTRTVKSHLHPVFNERLEFRVEAPALALLNIEVWDKDLMSDDRLGHIEPLDLNNLEALCAGRRHEMEINLVGKKAKKGSTVTIALEWYFSDFVHSMGKGKAKETVKPVAIPGERLAARQDFE